MHTFPKDPEMREAWTKAIPRVNWEPGLRSRICSLHFEQEDFIKERQDSNKRRKYEFKELKLKRLKKTAVPTKFNGKLFDVNENYFMHSINSIVLSSTY